MLRLWSAAKHLAVAPLSMEYGAAHTADGSGGCACRRFRLLIGGPAQEGGRHRDALLERPDFTRRQEVLQKCRAIFRCLEAQKGRHQQLTPVRLLHA